MNEELRQHLMMRLFEARGPEMIRAELSRPMGHVSSVADDGGWGTVTRTDGLRDFEQSVQFAEALPVGTPVTFASDGLVVRFDHD